MNVFGLDVIEVLDVRASKRSYQGVDQVVTYASLLCEGGTIRAKVQDGVEIPIGWSGKAVGYCAVKPYKEEFFGKQGKTLSDATALGVSLITEFQAISQVKRSSNALSSFMGSAARQESGAAGLPKMPTNK